MKTNLLKTRIACGVLAGVALTVMSTGVEGAETEAPKIQSLELQPVAAQVRRVVEALDLLGAPLSSNERERIVVASQENEQEKGLSEIQTILDPHCLAVITINPEMRVKASPGPVKRDLVEGGWRTFLLKIQNDAGST